MTRFGRRGFVRGAGLSLLAAPFLGPLRGVSYAGGTPTAKRLVVFFTPNGTVHRHWRPTGTDAAFEFPAGSILEPLTPHKRDLLVLDGINFEGVSNHEGGMSNMLTGGGGASTATRGMSVDQYVASRIGGESRFASMEFGVQTSAWGGGTQTRISYRAPGEHVPPADDPVGVYRRMFGAVMPAPGMMDAAMARRRSVLDALSGELADFQRRVGADDRRKLEAHADALRRMETGLMGGGAMASCTTPPPVAAIDAMQNDNFPLVGRSQMDLLVTALACGMTRVASLQWSHTVGPPVFSWVGLREGHHGLSHMDDSNTAGVRDFVTAERWFAEQFAYLVGRLAELPEPGGTGRMLDHTLVVWSKEMGDSRLHDCVSVPFVLAGQAGGYLRTGRYVRLGGVPHQKLLVTICQAMGLDNPTFGDPSHGTGPLAALQA